MGKETDQVIADQEAADAALQHLMTVVDAVNEAWSNVNQKQYRLWVDWEARPLRIVITEGIRVERNIIYP